MSKKIIYLLSLLMALSLVFASCKKTNNGGITGGDIPGEEPGTIAPPDLSEGGGLFTDQGKLDEYAEKPVQISKIAEFGNNSYMRNPVITVIGGKAVAVFYEVRYESPGSANDTALTGTNTVDIVYTVSEDAGISFDTSTSTKYVGPKATSPETSHGAPVVFNTGDKIVVVASAGIGLGVGSKDKGVSKLQYSVASINGTTIGDFSAWKDINISSEDIKGTTVQFEQFGTLATRGVVTSDKKLLLAVTVANFINNQNGWGDSRWGYVAYEGTVSGSDVTWQKVSGAPVVEMQLTDKTKATKIVKANNTDDFIALTVNDKTSELRLYQSTKTGTTTKTSIQAGDGSAGTLVVPNWIGGSYDPKAYASGSVTGTPQSILSHVEVLEKQLAIRLVDANFQSQQGNSFIPAEEYKSNSKSSSMDILSDGTIVVAAEGGKVNQGSSERQFYIHFYRYTQAYLATQTGNAAN